MGCRRVAGDSVVTTCILGDAKSGVTMMSESKAPKSTLLHEQKACLMELKNIIVKDRSINF